MQIESIELRNYRVFRDAKIDRLSRMAVIVGANGAGKSTLFDVFSFLKQCLAENVAKAVASRGGFKELVSRGHETETIGIKLRFRDGVDAVIKYEVDIGFESGRVVVEQELLVDSGGTTIRQQYLTFAAGMGSVVDAKPASDGSVHEGTGSPYTIRPDALGLAVVGQGDVIPKVRSYIENWHVSNISPDAVARVGDARLAEHVTEFGENVAQVAKFMFENHREQFDLVLQRMRDCIPGVTNVEAKTTEDGRVVLRFHDGAFKDPFSAQHVSDGTLKMFAYLVLFYDPRPHPLLAIEEPESHIYPELLAELVEELGDYARRGGQVFVATHSPELLNRAKLSEIYWLVKQGGFSTFQRVGDSQLLNDLVQAGDLPGTLWKRGLFEAATSR